MTTMTTDAPATVSTHAARRPFRRGDRLGIVRDGERLGAEVVNTGSGIRVMTDRGRFLWLRCGELVTREMDAMIAVEHSAIERRGE